MAKIKTECPICGTVTKTAAAPTMCARCGADLTRPGVEAVVYTARCNCVPNGQRAMRAGNLFVTNYRFFWLENATTGIGAMGGLVGVLVESAVKSMQMPGMAFCLALNDIGELTDARFGVRKTLQVTSLSQGPVGQLIGSKPDDVRAAVAQAVRQFGSQPG